MSAVSAATMSESAVRFGCFGGTCTVLVQGGGPAGPPPMATERVKRRLLEWHGQFSRFSPSSELSRLNRDPRERVPVSSSVDHIRNAVVRPAGVRLDSGGGVKGPFADVVAPLLAFHEAFALEAAGDVRLGGAGGVMRLVQVTNPLGPDMILHRFELVSGAVATSGTTKRRWTDERGRLAHHLLDPSTGRPAFTGIAQATASPSGVEAEALAKAALLGGPEAAPSWLRHGGVIVYDDGTHEVIEARR